MTFEEKYATIVKMCQRHLDEEEVIAKGSKSISTIYSTNHPLHALLTLVFANLFVADARRTYEAILRVETRAPYIKRIRELVLMITTLVGDDCVQTIINNQVDGILRISGQPSRALKRALEKVFKEQSTTWIIIILGGLYTTNFNIRVEKKHVDLNRRARH